MIESNDDLVRQAKSGLSKQIGTLGKLLLNNRLVKLIEIGVVFSPVLLVIFVFRWFGLQNAMLMIGAVWLANVFMIVFVSAGVILRRESWNSVGLNFEWTGFAVMLRTVLTSVPIFVFAIAAFVFGTIVMANIVGIPEGADLSKYNYLRENLPMLLLSLAGVYIVASFGEELVYRGFLITRLTELFGDYSRFKQITILLLSSIIFGFAHFEWGMTGIVQTTFMGAALGLSFLLTRKRLWPLILAHGYMDTILMVQLYFAS